MSQDDVPMDWEEIDTSDTVLLAAQAVAPPPGPMFSSFCTGIHEPDGDVSTQQFALRYTAPVPQQPQPRTDSMREPKVKRMKEKVEAKEQAIDKDQLVARQLTMAEAAGEALSVPDATRVPVNIVFIGHVDAGKSTICGNILLSLGKVDQRAVERYETEAREKGRDSWWLAYIMDQNEEERVKGITIEVGRAGFETRRKRFTVLDAPGHKDFVPNMMAGAAQADYAAVVVSARVGEFEAGFDRGGQTQEHALLAKSSGISRLIVLVNKMDDFTVQWRQDRFDYIRACLEPYLRDVCHFDTDHNVSWVPLSGLTGDNLSRPVACSWDCGPPLLDVLDSLPLPPHSDSSALRIPVLDRFRDQGLWILGKVESGKIVKGQELIAVPGGTRCEVLEIYQSVSGEESTSRLVSAETGENLRIRVRVPDDIDIQKGVVLCDPWDLCKVAWSFKAQVRILDLLEHKPLITAGYQCVLHIHTAVVDCMIAEVTSMYDLGKRQTVKTVFGKSGSRLSVKIHVSSEVCVEPFNALPFLGRFILRDEGKTIGFGKVTQLLDEDC